jgi:hypothetical protein
MTGKRKLFMFYGQLLVAGLLCGLSRMTGAEFVGLETIAIPAFIAGNFGEHFTAAKEAKNAS